MRVCIRMQSELTSKLISIIVPVYCTASYLERCIYSIQSQTYTTWEIILIDDGSKDSSSQKCDEIAKKDSRIKVIHQNNRGVSAARNTGLSLTAGEYITFIDSDDYVESNFLEYLLLWLNNSNADIAACGYYLHRGNKVKALAKESKLNVLYDDSALITMMQRNYYQGFLCNKLFKASLFYKKENSFCEEISICEDLLFLTECFLEGASIVYHALPLYHYCIREESLVHQMGKVRDTELKARQLILDKMKIRSTRAMNLAKCKYSEAAVNLLYSAYYTQNVSLIKIYRREAKKFLRLYYRNPDIIFVEKLRMFLKYYFPKTSVSILEFIRRITE